MQDLLQWLRDALGLSPGVQSKLFASFFAILLIWVLRKVVLFIFTRQTSAARVQYRWRKTTSYVAFAIAILLIGHIWFEGFKAVSTYLGIVSAGIAIALRDPLVNLAGWAFIVWRRPFSVGDRIEIGQVAGDVIDLRIFQFTLMEIGNWVDADQSTGRVIHVPNGSIFRDVLANYSRGFQYIWNEVAVLVTFESNWKKAKDILLGIGARHAEHLSESAEERLQRAAKKFMIFFTKLTPTVYTRVKESGVLLTIRYLCEPRRRRTSEQEIWEDILEQFAECDDIDFAYPSQRFYLNYIEGKAGTKPSSDQFNDDPQMIKSKRK